MKKIIKKFVWFIISNILDLIHFFQYFNKEEPNDLNKINEILKTDDLEVETDTGFHNSEELNITEPFYNYKLKLESGKQLSSAKGHIVVMDDYTYNYIENLKKGDLVMTKDGSEKVVNIKKTNIKTPMADLSINSQDSLYYTNEILSHNTVTTALYILWYVTFHSNKGVMIIANKQQTVVEILDKIKNIYKHVPFFLKPGVTNWAQQKISFDNGCRVQTDTRSKEPAIGFTVDLLYFDEFAHIPSNVIEPYYKAAVPTVAAVENSKIIITSTPSGFNLFHRLWTNANRDEDDPEKGPHKPMKVLWWQVEGRRDTWILPNKKICKKYSIRGEDIFKFLKEQGYEIYKKHEDGYPYRKIKFKLDDEEKTNIDTIRKLRYKSIPLPELCHITNWKEEQIKLFGSEESFKQEFEVKFMSGDKSLFDDIEVEKIKNRTKEFKHFKLPELEKKLNVSYQNLKFIDNKNIFDLSKAKDYYLIGGIDFAEGLGKDYTVFTLYKIKMKDKKEIIKNKHKFASIYDYFQAEQVGIFRSNHHSIKEFAHIFYLLCFEFLDPQKIKINFEYNQFGGEFIAQLPNVFEGNNEFASHIFARFKHSQDAKQSKLGLKIGQNKNPLIKDYQLAVKKQNIIIHHEKCIDEMEMFTRHDTHAGNYTYKAESGTDDCVMSIVNAVSLMNNQAYKNLLDIYINEMLDEESYNFINNEVEEKGNAMTQSYDTLFSSLNNFKKGNNGPSGSSLGLPGYSVDNSKNIPLI